MNYSEEQRTVGVFAARTAPACDSCLRRRGLWFCNADDAFLCQACDASVHSANSLARRHHRVRLNSASSPSRSSSPSSFVPETTNDFQDENETPAWLHGLTRKPRTSRGKPRAFTAVARAASKVESLVPDLEDLSAEENQPCEQEEQLFYCVPILDAAVLSEFCTQPHQIDDADSSFHEVKPAVQLPEYDQVLAVAATPDSLAGFRPTADLDLEEFTSDVEKLLGQRFDDDDAFLIDGLSLVNEGLMEDDKGQVMKLDTASGDLRTEIKEHEHKAPQDAAAKRRRAKILKLDYEAVIAAWSSNGCSPWTGEGPQIDPKDDIWTDFAANIGGGGGEVRGLYQQVAMAAEGKGREARVSRYREKRRTRLFSKKIRYEVRKLNAEKRPRMKGRFVTRAAAAAAEFPAAVVASTLPYL